jgi:hypothetical protein
MVKDQWGRNKMNSLARTPLHLWVVGVVSLLWNAINASDYIFTKMNNDWYLKEVGGFTAEQIAYFQYFPLWANVGWALGVWGAIAGSLLLLARSRHAVTAFLVSLLGLAISTFYQLGAQLSEFMRLFGQGPMIFTAVIWAIAIALYLYARRQAASGVLR